jgi:SAM-dependent methyltransferase
MPDEPAPSSTPLKEQVKEFWEQQSCDTQVAQAEKYSKEYFESVEEFRYFDQPFIHSFAQFSRYRDKRVLEIGFGAGTDFIQWLRAGAKATGLDLTEEAMRNLTHRIAIYQLPQPERILVGDAENLPFESNAFDLGYSFGVLHHTPNTEKAIAELVRVVRPGGEVKLMLYNRRAIYIINLWIQRALLRGRPWKSLRWVMWNYLESVGTKGYTRKELVSLLTRLGLDTIEIRTEATAADFLSASAMKPLNWLFRIALRAAGWSWGWHTSHYSTRVNDPHPTKPKLVETQRCSHQVLLTGNPLGYFHCIYARKPTALS